MTDRYTKLVLTVIAAALVALTAIQLTTPAGAEIGQCLEDRPCYVVNVLWNKSSSRWEACTGTKMPCFIVDSK
jgi:hypothetical protein